MTNVRVLQYNVISTHENGMCKPGDELIMEDHIAKMLEDQNKVEILFTSIDVNYEAVKPSMDKPSKDKPNKKKLETINK